MDTNQMRELARQAGRSGRGRGRGVRMEQAADEIDRLRVEVEALKYERDLARARADSAVQLLVGIHSLLYPPPIKTVDDRTLVLRLTNDPDPNDVLQELSDRIRALPEKLAAMKEQQP